MGGVLNTYYPAGPPPHPRRLPGDTIATFVCGVYRWNTPGRLRFAHQHWTTRDLPRTVRCTVRYGDFEHGDITHIPC